MSFAARFLFADGHTETIPVQQIDHCIQLDSLKIPRECTAVDLLSEEFTAPVGQQGYFVIPSVESNGNAAQVFFTDRNEAEERYPFNSLPIFIVTKDAKGLLAVVTGRRYEYELVVGYRNGRYFLYPHFTVESDVPQRDIEIRLIELEGQEATWQGAARAYRQFQLDRGVCRPLVERLQEQPVLAEALKGPEVRVRLAWKPVPSPVPEQTEENEPPIHVAITFEQCEQIMEEFHSQGIEHAEFCLVGWNKSGHDGRFPDLFPVEPKLGGEKALRHLIDKAKSYGYLITGHTNLTDSYKIAKRWKIENCLIDKDGSLHQCGNWGGGNSYYLCPKKAYEEYAVQDFPDLKALGFKGLHYLDVLTIVPPTRCHSPKHPLTFEECVEWRSRTLELARQTMGGSASEGAWDFCVGSFDYSLYTIYHRKGERHYIFADHFVPFYHIAYHGILLYNTFCDTVNAAIKPDKSLSLLNFLYGGRPVAYFNAKFLSQGANWMGNDDLTFQNSEQLATQVALLKKEYDEYSKLLRFQTEFMEDFQELVSDALYQVTYSSGCKIIFNLSPVKQEAAGVRHAPFSWTLCNASC